MIQMAPTPREAVFVDDLVEDVCWQLADHTDVCRIGYVVDGRPAILPVNFQLLGHTIVFRTAVGSSLDALADGTPVVVEVDRLDEDRRVGWSVVVHGEIEHIDDSVQLFIDRPVETWAADDKVCWMWVLADSVTGRAISRPQPPPHFRLPYMPLD